MNISKTIHAPPEKKKQGCDKTMNDKPGTYYLGAILATVVLTAYPILMVGAQVIPSMSQAMNLEEFPSDLQTLLSHLQSDFNKREQSSLSLRGFSGSSIFSCRGLA